MISAHCLRNAQIYKRKLLIFIINSYEESHTMDALDGEERIRRWILTTALQIPMQGTGYR